MGDSNTINEALSLQSAAADPGAHIVQVCCLDHATSAPNGDGHLHLQVHFSDQSHSQWFVIHGVTLQELKDCLAESPRRPRLHLHADNRPKRTDPEFAEALPRGKLAAAVLLRDVDCPVCLASFTAGEDVVVLPCSGQHTVHSECLRPWLKTASTCPTCRHALPITKSSAAEVLEAPAMQSAWAKMRWLQGEQEQDEAAARTMAARQGASVAEQLDQRSSGAYA